ncbi:S4 domain-containing protein [Paludibacterium denitrificans]|uniref:S4 domain-containing protein n=1 Tax=Paludibacterium denitrificans TaxID=2675226 RepID=UPI0028B1E0FD|nr:S4 domain-containing protein [Paludibacterium denitrificans]
MMRVDVLLVEQGLAPSRTAAQHLIEAGRVSSAGMAVTKSSQKPCCRRRWKWCPMPPIGLSRVAD